MAFKKLLHKLPKFAVALAVGIAVWISFPSAFADRFNTETSASVRALGMGNAAINTERGAYAVFYNPANISAKDTRVTLQPLNLKLGMSEGTLSPTAFSPPSFARIKENPNKMVAGNYSVYPNLTMRNLSFGMLYEKDEGAYYRASDGAVHILARDRFAPTLALSFRLWGGIIRVGAASQYLTVGNADRWTSSAASSLDFKSNIAAGSAFSHSGGVTLTFPVRYLPSFSVVARNIGDPAFSGPATVKFGDAATPSPGGTLQQRMTFDAAMSVAIHFSSRITTHWEINYRDTVNKLLGSNARHIFAGTEWVLYDMFKLRAGMAHGYLSGGFGVGTDKTSLEVAIYSDEIGDRYRTTKDTRFLLQYSFGIFK